MNNQPDKNHNSDEIDIIKFFSYIGESIGNLFRGIGKIFAGIFHVLVLFLIMIQQNIIYFIIALVVGGVGGAVLDYLKKPVYLSEMVVQPNFGSVKQLYNKISYFNELATSRDSVKLGHEMGITSDEAACVLTIEVEPLVDQNGKLKLYDQFIQNLDTLTKKSFDYTDYAANFNDFDAVEHKISVKTTNTRGIAIKMQDSIVNSVKKNSFYIKQEEVYIRNTKFQDTILHKQLREVDSLQNLFTEVLKTTASNPGNTGTNITLTQDDNNTKSKQLELFSKVEEIKENIIALNTAEVVHTSAINVLAEFPERGTRVSGITKKMKLILPMVFVTIVVLVLLLGRLNNYLKNYSKE